MRWLEALVPIEFDAAKREATLEARGLDHRVPRRHDGDPRLDTSQRHASDYQYEESQ